jgi:hypothetical protein
VPHPFKKSQAHNTKRHMQCRATGTREVQLPCASVPSVRLATLSNASSGHSMNQSMAQQFTSEGNMRSLVRKASPRGLMHSTKCTFVRTRCSFDDTEARTNRLSRV